MNTKCTKTYFTYEIMEKQWENITLDQFTQIRAILEDKEKNEEDKMISLAAVVQGVDEETILTMPLAQVQPIFASLQGLDRPPQRGRIRRHYQVGKWSLVTTDATKMSVAQWIDFQNYAQDGMEKHLADILSVALVPVGKTYNEGYEMGELKAALGGMGVCDAMAVCFFFQRKWLRSMKRTLNYLVGWTSLKGKKELTRKALEVRAEVSALLRSL